MNRKKINYAIFAFVASLFAVGSSIAIALIALNRAQSEINYPSVAKQDYVDCSSSFAYGRGDGCQPAAQQVYCYDGNAAGQGCGRQETCVADFDRKKQDGKSIPAGLYRLF